MPDLKVGEKYTHDGKDMGKFISYKLVGRVYDPDPEYTFEKGKVTGLGLTFIHYTDPVIKTNTPQK